MHKNSFSGSDDTSGELIDKWGGEMLMRELHYEQKGVNSYLIYTVGAEDSIDTLSLGMLTNNEIEGIIPTQFLQMDDTKQILFNVSGKVSAAQILKGPINRKRLVGMMSGVVKALLAAEEYMLEPKSLLLGMEYIFVDTKTSETSVICLPLENIFAGSQNLHTFFKEMVFQAQFDQTEGYDHIAQILNFINGSAELSLVNFKSLLEKLNGTQAQSAAPAKVPGGAQPAEDPARPLKADPVRHHEYPPMDGPAGYGNTQNPPAEEAADDNAEPEISLMGLLTQFNSERYEKYKAQQKKKKDDQRSKKGKDPAKQAKKEQSPNSGFDLAFAVPGAEDQFVKLVTPEPVRQPAAEQVSDIQPEADDGAYTEVLMSGNPGTDVLLRPFLVRLKTGEKIFIPESSFVIGKKRSEVDYCITNNKTVSRMHAIITHHDNEYFVADLESTNFTYVNGKKIPAKEEVLLAVGTRICFSDEEFEFGVM